MKRTIQTASKLLVALTGLLACQVIASAQTVIPRSDPYTKTPDQSNVLTITDPLSNNVRYIPGPGDKSIPASLIEAQNTFTDIAKSAEPFVVNIDSTRPVSADSPDDDGTDTPPAAPAPGNNPAFPREEEATGSGVIVRSDGYILTNDHVVEGSQYVTVTTSDGHDYRGTVIRDFHSDLALVKIDTGGLVLPTATFDADDDVQPGQWAIAIGSPFDLQNTMTVGVISALHRHQTIGDDVDSRYYPDLIQTDAAINPGNSGGPLLNIWGDVVGVNVAIESPVEGSSGVGFAIPASTATYVVDQLIKNGKVIRGYLGVGPVDLTPTRAQEFGVATGAWVKQVIEDSPAGRAGVHAADIVTKFDGKPVTGEVSLRTLIAETAPGTPVTLDLVRDGKPLTISTVIGTPPPSDSDSTPAVVPTRQLGLTYKAITATARQDLGLSPSTNGVLVTAVAANSPADEAEFSQDDVIEQIGLKHINSVDDASAAFDAIEPDQTETVVVLRKAGTSVEEEALDIKL